MNPVSVWWKVHVFKQGRDPATLNEILQTLHPGAPEVLIQHRRAMDAAESEVVIDGKDGSRLILTRGGMKSVSGALHYQVLVSFQPGDYGLAEFDRISASLAHSAPVAAAIELIRREESKLPPLSAAPPSEPGPARSAAPSNSNLPPVKQAGEKPKTFRQAFMDGWNGSSDSP